MREEKQACVTHTPDLPEHPALSKVAGEAASSMCEEKQACLMHTPTLNCYLPFPLPEHPALSRVLACEPNA